MSDSSDNEWGRKQRRGIEKQPGKRSNSADAIAMMKEMVAQMSAMQKSLAAQKQPQLALPQKD